MNILMIEDDDKFARLVEKIMQPAGHTIRLAPTAMDGLNKARDEDIDLVLLDMNLPDLDGKMVATILRSRPGTRKVPIIAVTAQNDNVARRLALSFGCDGFITKPIDTRQFPAQVLSYLDKDLKSV
ncbi:MAG: response regulator [Anaerolineae bacterium]|jgi:two-component system cell cycle response regulator DivK|nr:response regulator [Anaerolineae bacterium]